MKKTLSLEPNEENNIPQTVDLDNAERGVYWQGIFGRTHTAILVAIQSTNSIQTKVIREYLDHHPEII